MFGMKKKAVTVWFAVNKSGFVGMYADEPVKNEETGKWESKFPFVNSVIYDQIVNLIDKTGLNWESEAQCITFQTSN